MTHPLQEDPAAALQEATATTLFDLSAALEEVGFPDMQRDEVGWAGR